MSEIPYEIPYRCRSQLVFRPVLRIPCIATTLLIAIWIVSGLSEHPEGKGSATAPNRALPVRIGVETLRNPYWYADNGYPKEAGQFWDKDRWDHILRRWADEGYNHLVYWIEPWNKHAWQTFLIAHDQQPEAKILTAEQSDKLTQ